jgi:5-methylcytosine-specific restriction endonuclease McrA
MHRHSLREHESRLETINRLHTKRAGAMRTGPCEVIGTAVTTDALIDILKRQKWLCIFCGASIRHNYTLDHIVPLTKNGQHILENILCLHCNISKGNRGSNPKTIQKPRLLISYLRQIPEDQPILRELGIWDEWD